MVAAAAHATMLVHALPRSVEGTSWMAHAATPSIPREPAMRMAPPSRLRDRRLRITRNMTHVESRYRPWWEQRIPGRFSIADMSWEWIELGGSRIFEFRASNSARAELIFRLIARRLTNAISRCKRRRGT